MTYMQITTQLILSLLPAILLGIYIWKKDPQKEPTWLLIKAVLYGAGICIPVGLLELSIQTIMFGEDKMPSTLFGSTSMAFFVAAIPEECFKLWALWLILRRNPYFDEHFDGIVYAVCVALGFATIENIGYVLGEEEDWIIVAATRALLSVPGHYAFAVLMGYYYSVYHFVNNSNHNKVMILLMPVIAHGIYDSIAMASNVTPIIGGACAILLVFFCIKMHKFAYKKLITHIQKDQDITKTT